MMVAKQRATFVIEHEDSIEIFAFGRRIAPTAPEEFGVAHACVDCGCGRIPQGIVIDHHDNLLDLGLDRGGHCRARPFGVNRVRCVNRAEQAEAKHGNKQHNHRNDG